MNDALIELYFDEHIDPVTAEIIKARGFRVSTTVEQSNRGKSDPEQLAYAVNRESAIVTHNRVDFEILAREYFESDKTHFGIIIGVRRPPPQVSRRLLVILNSSSREEMKNQLIYI